MSEWRSIFIALTNVILVITSFGDILISFQRFLQGQQQGKGLSDMATINQEVKSTRNIWIRTGGFGKRFFDIVVSAMG